MIRWCYAFVDRPRESYEAARAFWAAATGSTVSAPRGAHGEFATLLPPAGDAYLKTQAVGTAGGSHLDFATADVAGLVARAVDRGAQVTAEPGGYAVLRSPGGAVFCAVPWHGEVTRPAVVTAPDGSRSRLDQVTVDVAPALFEAEVAFWAGLTGWASYPSDVPEFQLVKPGPEQPLRILVQRLAADRPTGMHPDLACADNRATRAVHEALGATVVGERLDWIVMRDPAGGLYCLTSRDPETGVGSAN